MKILVLSSRKLGILFYYRTLGKEFCLLFTSYSLYSQNLESIVIGFYDVVALNWLVLPINGTPRFHV